tara:strand:- start:282 stop:407 length:126 start_codon:yes stop_codon:yes gene_type:complete
MVNIVDRAYRLYNIETFEIRSVLLSEIELEWILRECVWVLA